MLGAGGGWGEIKYDVQCISNQPGGSYQQTTEWYGIPIYIEALFNINLNRNWSLFADAKTGYNIPLNNDYQHEDIYTTNNHIVYTLTREGKPFMVSFQVGASFKNFGLGIGISNNHPDLFSISVSYNLPLKTY